MGFSGLLWRRLGSILGCLGGLWRAFGGIWGCLWPAVAGFWSIFGDFWGSNGIRWAILGFFFGLPSAWNLRIVERLDVSDTFPPNWDRVGGWVRGKGIISHDLVTLKRSADFFLLRGTAMGAGRLSCTAGSAYGYIRVSCGPAPRGCLKIPLLVFRCSL